MSQNTLTELHFDEAEGGKVKCRHCGRKFKKDRSNQRRHLQIMHSIDDSPQVTFNQLVEFQEKDKGRQPETVINVLASLGLPFAAVHDKYFRVLVSPMTLPGRRVMGLRTRKHAQNLLKYALQSLAGLRVTLAIDSGTIWKKFMVATENTPKGALLLRAECVQSCTAEWTAKFVERCIAMLPKSCDVVGICADNASNMQAAIPLVRNTIQTLSFVTPIPSQSTVAVSQQSLSQSQRRWSQTIRPMTVASVFDDNFMFLKNRNEIDLDIDVEAPISDTQAPTATGWYHSYRCLAHGIQLLSKDIIEANFPTLDEDLEEAKRLTGVRGNICVTRWNTRTDLCEKVLKRGSEIVLEQNPRLYGRLKAYMDIGLAFREATDIAQDDRADVWSACHAYQIIADKLTSLDNLEYALARSKLVERSKNLISHQMVSFVGMLPFKLEVALAIQESARKHAEHYASLIRNETDGKPPTESISYAEAIELFESYNSQGLISIILQFLETNPSEAAVERIFSALKRMTPANRKSLTPAAAIAQVFVNALNEYNSAKVEPKIDRSIKFNTFSLILRNAALQKIFLTREAPHPSACSFCKASEKDEDMLCCDYCSRWACIANTTGNCTKSKRGPGLWKCPYCVADNAILRTYESLIAEGERTQPTPVSHRPTATTAAKVGQRRARSESEENLGPVDGPDLTPDPIPPSRNATGNFRRPRPQ